MIDEASSRVRLQYSLPPAELRQAKQKLNEVLKEMNAIASKSRYDTSSTRELQRQEENIRERITELELEWASRKESMSRTVGEDDIAQIVQSWTGIPVKRLVEAETQKLLRMEEMYLF